jgi:hypothetical protein
MLLLLSILVISKCALLGKNKKSLNANIFVLSFSLFLNKGKKLIPLKAIPCIYLATLAEGSGCGEELVKSSVSDSHSFS